MSNEKLSALSLTGACLASGTGQAECADAHGTYIVECLDVNGNVRWTDTFDNLVTTVGKNDALDKYLSGAAYTAAWYVGLISSASYTTGVVAADTSAAHGGWTEDQNYSQAARPTAAWAVAATGSKSLSSAAVFTLNGNTTIKGCFLMSISTKGGTTGILYSAGLFTAGDKVVQTSDTLNVSYTASL